MDHYVTSHTESTQSSAALSDSPSFESLRSTSSRRQTGYSHLLYSLPVEKKDSILMSSYEVSRFSSCSTSPNSSCESVNVLQPTSTLRDSGISHLSLSSIRSGSSRDSRSASAKYIDDHYPLITSIAASRKETHASIMDMAHAYNTYIRAINSCYNNAAIIDDDEIADYLFFSQTLFNVLSQQLKIDQQNLVPLLHKPVLHPRVAVRKSVSIHENLTFRSSFHAWAQYVHDPSTVDFFSAHELQAYMSTFAPILVQHLHDEVYSLNTLINDGTLMPEHLSKIWSKTEEDIANTFDLYTDAALLIGCHDKHFTINGQRAEQKFPQLPLGTTTMVKKWHSRRHEGAWRFCPSDFSGKRRVISA